MLKRSLMLRRILGTALACVLLVGCEHNDILGDNKPLAKTEPAPPIQKVSTDAYFGLPTFYDEKREEQIAWHVWRGNKAHSDFMNAGDRLELAKAQSTARLSETNKKIHWRNPKSGNEGFVVTLKEGYDSLSRPCRRFMQVNKIRGQESSATAVACKDFDGDWYVIEE